jgi:hypothetical protein
MNTHPDHVHPRQKRTAPPKPYRPLFKPIVPVKKSKARPAHTYRGHPDHLPRDLPAIYVGTPNEGKYTGEKLRKIRAIKGVGRPV